MSEKGHAKNLENFKKLRDFIAGWGARYAAVNPLITLVAVNAMITAAQAAGAATLTAKTPYTIAVSEAEDAFAPLNKLVTRTMNMFKASGAPASAIADALTYSRKIQGKRATPAKKDDPATPDVDESKQSHSASQQSRAQRIEALDALIEIYKAYPIYDPSEEELKIATLEAVSADLKAKVAAVNSSFVGWSNKLAERDALYYAETTGFVDRAYAIKNYVKAAFGTDSAEYNQIKGLKFTRIVRD